MTETQYPFRTNVQTFSETRQSFERLLSYLRSVDDRLDNLEGDPEESTGLHYGEWMVPMMDVGAVVGTTGDVQTVTSATTLNSAHRVVLCDASGGAFTVTLPAVASSIDQEYWIKKIDNSANAVTIDGISIETVDDQTTRILSMQYDAVHIVPDSTGWWIL